MSERQHTTADLIITTAEEEKKSGSSSSVVHGLDSLSPSESSSSSESDGKHNFVFFIRKYENVNFFIKTEKSAF
jgi:hypothetical protein